MLLFQYIYNTIILSYSAGPLHKIRQNQFFQVKVIAFLDKLPFVGQKVVRILTNSIKHCKMR